MKIINRTKYIDFIKPFVNKDLIKVLVGSRRTGKTCVLLQLIDELKIIDTKANIIYINKEDADFRNITDHVQLYDYVKSKSKQNAQNFVLIDEVQEIKNFEIALRELLVKKYDIYCTGSNARMLSSDLATHLSGRYIEIPIYGLSFQEFMSFHGLDKNKDTLLKFIKYGGLPYLINLKLEDDVVYQYHKNIYNTIILKDIVARYSIRDVDFLDRLTEYLCDCLGSYVSSKKITDFLKAQQVKLSINTVQNYLQYLVNSFFVDRVKRYDIQGKKLFEINDKYYFRDLGLKHSIVPYKPNDISKVLENLVYNKLVSDHYKVNIGKLGDMEIDFIATKNNQTKYIQVAYQLTDDKVMEREFGNLLQIPDNYEKIVVSADDFATGNYKGIKHIHILDFLTV